MFNFLRALAVTLPAVSMVAAHYIPWRKSLGRNLHRLEAYAIGTGAIVGTAVALLQVADATETELSPSQSSELVSLSAIGAGTATVMAWSADWLIEHRHRRLDNLDRQNVTR